MRRPRRFTLAVIALLAVAAVVAARVGGTSRDAPAGTARTRAAVVRVIDGDTFDARVPGGATERVRILGIDTPEAVDPRRPVQCFGPEASARLRAILTPGRAVLLEADPTQSARDAHGRRLAHVFLDGAGGGLPAGTNVARSMIEDGFARHYVYAGTPVAYGREYATAQATARARGAGLWSPATCNGKTSAR